MNFINSSLLAGVCLLVVNSSLAETKRDLDSHEHGASTLNVVIDNNDIFIEFESPWMNLLGFEHSPSTDEQNEELTKALGTLEKTDQLFSLDATAECKSVSAQVTNSMHEEESHDDEKSEPDSHEHDGGTEEHSEVMGEYVISCKKPSQLKSLSVHLFDLWPGINDVDVQLVGPGGQTAVELDPSSTTVDLAEVR